MEKMDVTLNTVTTFAIKMGHKIETWNVNGLAKHSQEIKIFIFNQNILYIYSNIYSYIFYLFLLRFTLQTKAIPVFLDIHCIIQ